jgi:Mu transposase-like protein
VFDHLLPLPSEGFDLVEVSFARMDGPRRVRVRTNAYSAPLPPGTTVQVKLGAASVELWHQGRCVARHARSYARHQEILDLEHYLDVLERKPGALAGSKPLEQWRHAGRWPTSDDRLWQALMERQGRQLGTKLMIELLQLGCEHGFGRLRVAIEAALELGCTDAAAVRHLVAAEALVHQRPAPLVELGVLSQYERPLPELHAYDDVLVVAGGVG